MIRTNWHASAAILLEAFAVVKNAARRLWGKPSLFVISPSSGT